MESTYKKVSTFQGLALSYLERNKTETKLTAALNDILDQLPKIGEAYVKKLNKLKRNNAAVDKQGCILRDDNGGYKYTKDAEEVLDEQLEELLNEEREFEIEPSFVEIPEHFEKSLIKYFTGFVFNPAESIAK